MESIGTADLLDEQGSLDCVMEDLLMVRDTWPEFAGQLVVMARVESLKTLLLGWFENILEVKDIKSAVGFVRLHPAPSSAEPAEPFFHSLTSRSCTNP